MAAEPGRMAQPPDRREATRESTREAFGAGPCSWLPLMIPGRVSHRAWRDAFLTALVGWLPLALLAAAEGHFNAGRSRESLLFDAGAYARYVVAAPLFV